MKILPSRGDSQESFFHSLIAASNWPRDAKSCALCNTLLRSIAKSDLHDDQTLTVSRGIVNELGLWLQAMRRNVKACLRHEGRPSLTQEMTRQDWATAIFRTFEA